MVEVVGWNYEGKRMVRRQSCNVGCGLSEEVPKSNSPRRLKQRQHDSMGANIQTMRRTKRSKQAWQRKGEANKATRVA